VLRLERKAGASIRRSSVQKKRMMVTSQGPPSRSRSFFVMPERSARFDSARLFLVAYRGGFTGNCFTGMPPNSYRGPDHVIPVRRSKRSHQGRLPYSLSLGEFGADHTPSMTASAHLLRRSACRSAYIPGMHGEAVAPPTPPPPLEICPTVATTPRSSPPTFNVSPSRITTRASTLTPSDSTTVRSRRTWSLTSILPGKSGGMSRPTAPTRPKTTIVHLISARIPILQVRI